MVRSFHDWEKKNGENFFRHVEEYEQLWNPKIEVNKSLELKQLLGPESMWNFKDPTTGMMKFTQRFRGYIFVDMDVRDFPFDSTDVNINIGCQVSRRRI